MYGNSKRTKTRHTKVKKNIKVPVKNEKRAINIIFSVRMYIFKPKYIHIYIYVPTHIY